ncbi:Chromate resistance protein ChrB, partial [Streptomyces wuyuanensis]|uniref:Chromate resistance protein ChrB n=1 Tax=Streptomyces wuyuanensis TaxID=1196353 RepID=UPI0037F585D8
MPRAVELIRAVTCGAAVTEKQSLERLRHRHRALTARDVFGVSSTPAWLVPHRHVVRCRSARA